MTELILIGFYVIILLYAVIIHEISHGVVALWLGDVTAKYAGRLTLNPKTHIDPIGSILVPGMLLLASAGSMAFGWAKPVPYNPNNLRDKKWGELLVAIAGPATNLFIATIAVILSHLTFLSSPVKTEIIRSFNDWSGLAPLLSGSIEAIVFLLLVYVVFWNVLLAFFNLIPVPPLDGSKILYAIVPIDIKTKLLLEQFGFFVLIFILLFFGGPIWAFLSWALGIFFGLMV
jgi:Zn-dependent protease